MFGQGFLLPTKLREKKDKLVYIFKKTNGYNTKLTGELELNIIGISTANAYDVKTVRN